MPATTASGRGRTATPSSPPCCARSRRPDVALPANAVGRDFRPWPYVGLTDSGTGVEASLWGLLGVKLGWVEGVELNFLGLVAGLDLRNPGVKLPGFGRIGPTSDRDRGDAALGARPTTWKGRPPRDRLMPRRGQSCSDVNSSLCSEARQRRLRCWPLAARAQQSGKRPVIGLLTAGAPATHGRWVAAFVQRLAELGWIDGRTVALEYRWAEGRSERYAQIAAEFVQRKVDVIVTQGGAVAAVKKATSIIPIVFTVAADPLGAGLVASLSRPGGNVTGLSLQFTDLAGKRLELLREARPSSRPLGDHGQCRLSRRRAGDGRGRGNRPQARPRSRHLANPARRGYRARHRGAQGPRRRPLCLWRPPRVYQPGSYQHPGAERASADDARYSANT